MCKPYETQFIIQSRINLNVFIFEWRGPLRHLSQTLAIDQCLSLGYVSHVVVTSHTSPVGHFSVTSVFLIGRTSLLERCLWLVVWRTHAGGSSRIRLIRTFKYTQIFSRWHGRLGWINCRQTDQCEWSRRGQLCAIVYASFPASKPPSLWLLFWLMNTNFCPLLVWGFMSITLTA